MATEEQKIRLNAMMTGIDNIGATYNERDHFATLTDPLRVAIREGGNFDDELLSKAEILFSQIEAPWVRINKCRSYLTR